MKSLINPKSYWQGVYNSSRADVDFSRSIEFRKNETINLFNKSFGISLKEFSVEYGRVGLCAMAQLEQERFIIRVPATDLYIKTKLSKEIIGNFRCLPKIEADLICKYIFEEKNPDLLAEFNIKELPIELGISPFDLFQEIDESEILPEGAILRHIEKYGHITRESVSVSDKKIELVEALTRLEGHSKIIRLVGTDNFIKALCIIMKSYPNTRDKISHNIKTAILQRQDLL